MSVTRNVGVHTNIVHRLVEHVDRQVPVEYVVVFKATSKKAPTTLDNRR